MANFLRITPFMHVADVGAAVDFFVDILGFEASYRQPGYAYIEREGCGIRILEAGEGNPLLPGNRRFRYYIDVRDVDGLYAELKPKLDTLPPDDVHGPADKPYGQRELLVKVPDGDLIAFGQALFTPEEAVKTPSSEGAVPGFGNVSVFSLSRICCTARRADTRGSTGRRGTPWTTARCNSQCS